MSMATVVLLSRLVLVVVFATAGVGKLLDLEGSRRAMRDFGVPDRLADAFGTLLPIAELVIAVGLVLRPTAQWAAVAALVLLLAFIGGILNALRHGVAPDCHCFGQIHSAPAGRSTLIRNGVLAVLAGIVVVEGPGPAVNTWVSNHSAADLATIVLAFTTTVLAMLWVQQRTQARRLGEEVGMARRIAASAPPGLPIGAKAPSFVLESLDGGTVTLEDLHERVPALLVFASPSCPSCGEVFPNIRRWQQTLQDRLNIAVVSVGSAKDNASLHEQYALDRVLLQQDAELIESYRIRGTPTAVLVTRDGMIGSVPAESVFGIEPLVRLVLRGDGLVSVPNGSIA
jgi:peroxiredoxin/uncharacterized membrane protein YphA (DoxX/SURF4 family)